MLQPRASLLKLLIRKKLVNNKTKQQKKADSGPTYSRILSKLEKLINNWEEAKNTDTFIFLSHPRKAIWANIVIGISRGVGFVIGVSIISVVVLTLLGWLLSHFVTIPVIGEFIAIIVKHVQEYLENK